MTTCGVNQGIGPLPSDPDNNSVLSAVPKFGGIEVFWTYPTTNPHALAHVNLYRSQSSDPVTKTLHRVVTGDSFFDRSEDATSNEEFFYWIEFVSINGTVGALIGPVSAIARPTVQDVLAMLQGEILLSNLNTTLQSEIARIEANKQDIITEQLARVASFDSLELLLQDYGIQLADIDAQVIDRFNTLVDEDEALSQRIEAVVATSGDNSAAVAQEAQARADADDALATRIDSVQAETDDNTAAITNEATARTDADSALASDIQTVQSNVDNNTASIQSEAQTRADEDTALAEQINTVAAAAFKVFRQNTAPDATADSLNENDLWVDTANGNRLFQWDGSAWVDIQDEDIAGAFAAIQDEQTARVQGDDALAQDITTLEASIGRKTRTYFQTTPPPAIAVENEGDLWIDTNDDNHLYRWDGSQWVSIRDGGVQAAIDDAAEAQSTADGKIESFYQDNPPTAKALGDLWFDTNDNNKSYRWNGSNWVTTQDGGIADALQAASDAQATADGKVVTFFQPTAPTAEGIGDLWIETDNNNKLYRWDGSQWLDATNLGTRVFRQDNEPTADNVGDIWFKENQDDKAYRWDGSNWIPLGLLNLTEVSAVVQDYNTAQVGFCLIGGNPTGQYNTKSACESNSGTWVELAALAQAVKGVQITDGTQTLSIEQQMTAHRNDLGGLEGQYTVKIDANGKVAGFGLASEPNDTTGGSFTTFQINVDRFAIVNTTNDQPVVPFYVQAGEVFIDAAVIADATISTAMIENAAITSAKIQNGAVTNLKIGNEIKSNNFITGSQGWRILKNGDIELNNAVFRGDLEGANGTFNGTIYAENIEGDVVDAATDPKTTPFNVTSTWQTLVQFLIEIPTGKEYSLFISNPALYWYYNNPTIDNSGSDLNGYYAANIILSQRFLLDDVEISAYDFFKFNNQYLSRHERAPSNEGIVSGLPFNRKFTDSNDQSVIKVQLKAVNTLPGGTNSTFVSNVPAYASVSAYFSPEGGLISAS